MQKIKIIAISLTLMAVGTLPVFAATSATNSATKTSPSPTVTPPSDEQTTENLKQRIDTVLKTRTDQVKGTIDELTQHKRGFIGQVERVIEKTVTVKNTKGTEILTIDPSVVVLRDNKKATLDDIAVGDWVIALGYNTDQAFTLRRLIVSTTSLMPRTYETVIGNVQTVTKTQVTLTGADSTPYQLNKDTHYEDAQGVALKLTDIKKDSQYLVISYTDQDKKIAILVKSLVATQK